MKPLLFLAGVLFLTIAATPKALASAEDQADSAISASKKWISQIDTHQYDESYAFGCGAMHDKVTQDRWKDVLRALRIPWGEVQSRKQLSHVYKPNGYEGTGGEFMVITYDTSFKRLTPATEVVVLKWENGQWRGAGYIAGAKSSPDDDSAPPHALASSTTETHTEAHVKPPQAAVSPADVRIPDERGTPWELSEQIDADLVTEKWRDEVKRR